MIANDLVTSLLPTLSSVYSMQRMVPVAVYAEVDYYCPVLLFLSPVKPTHTQIPAHNGGIFMNR